MLRELSLSTSGEIAPTVYDETTYFEQLVTDLDDIEAGEAVSMSTMNFDPANEQVVSVLRALTSAAVRGAEATLAVDSFALMDARKGALRRVDATTMRGSTVSRAVDTFAASHDRIHAGFTNYPTARFAAKYAGRSHIKSATTPSRLYVGGVSLDATDRLDAMVGVTHPEAAQWVYNLNREAIGSPSVATVLEVRDVVAHLGKDTQMLLDAGVRGQSVTLAKTLDTIDNARKKNTYASEQFPVGVVGRHLMMAQEKRGVEVTVASNHPSKHDRYRFAHQVILGIERRRRPQSFFAGQVSPESPTLHTKAIATEDIAIVGSHALNGIGVFLGTAELGIMSSNPHFVLEVEGLIRRQIRGKQGHDVYEEQQPYIR